MGTIQVKMMATQKQKQDERQKHQLVPCDKGRGGPWGAAWCETRPGRWSGADWGQTGVLVFLHENEEDEPWRRNTEPHLHWAALFMCCLWPSSQGRCGEGLRIPASTLDHTVGRGAHCRVTLGRIKLLVIAQSGPNKSQIPHSVLQGCFYY